MAEECTIPTLMEYMSILMIYKWNSQEDTFIQIYFYWWYTITVSQLILNEAEQCECTLSIEGTF